VAILHQLLNYTQSITIELNMAITLVLVYMGHQLRQLGMTLGL